jgi:hypothetical protein
MRVLIACEESQEVCKAFRKRGHEAFSCDIQECSGGHPEWHLQCDVREVLNDEWDLIIAHPPCTDLCVSGARWFEEKKKNGTQQKSIDFFMLFTDLKCEKVVIENPIGIMSNIYKKPSQIIQPWMFGDNVPKSTCLWIKGLPLLVPEITKKPEMEYVEWKDKKTGKTKRQAKWFLDALSSKDRSKVRSKTFPGIARAMAEQWG